MFRQSYIYEADTLFLFVMGFLNLVEVPYDVAAAKMACDGYTPLHPPQFKDTRCLYFRHNSFKAICFLAATLIKL